jgi:AraC-like DNA-binding protein
MADVFQKTADADPGGHLDPAGFDRHITNYFYPPRAALEPFISHFWLLKWDRAGALPYISEQVMHRPFVDVYIATREAGIQCTFRGKRAYQATSADRIAGARFRPGAFHAFWEGSPAGLHDRTLDIRLVFPEADTLFLERFRQLDDVVAIDALAELIQGRHPQPDPRIALVNGIIDSIDGDESIQTVREVARRFGWSERWIQQLFQEYVGVGLKWQLQRNKLLTAARRIRRTDRPNWSALAYELGYSSQQHFITEFKSVVGMTPLQYKTDVGGETAGMRLVKRSAAPPTDRP